MLEFACDGEGREEFHIWSSLEASIRAVLCRETTAEDDFSAGATRIVAWMGTGLFSVQSGQSKIVMASRVGHGQVVSDRVGKNR